MTIAGTVDTNIITPRISVNNIDLIDIRKNLKKYFLMPNRNRCFDFSFFDKPSLIVSKYPGRTSPITADKNIVKIAEKTSIAGKFCGSINICSTASTLSIRPPPVIFTIPMIIAITGIKKLRIAITSISMPIVISINGCLITAYTVVLIILVQFLLSAINKVPASKIVVQQSGGQFSVEK
jgi:hypothetical protein